LGKNSKKDMGLVVAHFDGDVGEVETFLSVDPIYTDNYLGTRRIDYGAKYNSVATFNITLIKRGKADIINLKSSDDYILTDIDGLDLIIPHDFYVEDTTDFSAKEIREYLKWLTGARSNSNLEFLIDDKVKYTFTGRFTNASHYKMDARTVGLVLEFTSIAPWAYSAPQIVEHTIKGAKTFKINCDTDDLYSHVHMKTTYANTNGGSVVIQNTTIDENTEINKLAENEIVTLDNNMMITSDRSDRIFGNDFNFIFPRLQAGLNEFNIKGNGNIKFEYIVPIKIGDVAIDINAYSAPICNDNGNIVIDTLPWSRIIDTPTTVIEYGIQDVYTKSEVDALFSSTPIHIDEEELNTMLSEVLI
jgi:hypothetical protein